jgi:acylphosphatase
MLKQALLYVGGDVIGVGFRAWTKIQAKIIGVSGWARNVYDRPDIFGVGGGVEILVQGEEIKVSRMVEVLKQGPLVSRVEGVEVCWQDPKEIYEGFEIHK